jgi:hypothetical protein
MKNPTKLPNHCDITNLCLKELTTHQSCSRRSSSRRYDITYVYMSPYIGYYYLLPNNKEKNIHGNIFTNKPSKELKDFFVGFMCNGDFHKTP